MNSSAKIVFLIVVAVTAVSASEEEFGVWMKGPNGENCDLLELQVYLVPWLNFSLFKLGLKLSDFLLFAFPS